VVEDVLRVLGDRRVAAEHAGVRERHVQAAEALDRQLHRARDAGPEEKPAKWSENVSHRPAYDEYQRKNERAIPVLVLERA
jgi:hypothetical protein